MRTENVNYFDDADADFFNKRVQSFKQANIKEMLVEAEKNLKEYVEEIFFPQYKDLLFKVFALENLLKQKKGIDNNEN